MNKRANRPGYRGEAPQLLLLFLLFLLGFRILCPFSSCFYFFSIVFFIFFFVEERTTLAMMLNDDVVSTAGPSSSSTHSAVPANAASVANDGTFWTVCELPPVPPLYSSVAVIGTGLNIAPTTAAAATAVATRVVIGCSIEHRAFSKERLGMEGVAARIGRQN